MYVLGGQVNDGKVYGTWPGLSTEQLYDHRDLQVTTDYRRVLSEILIRRLGNPKLGLIFPNYSNYAPLGIVQGTDLAPDYTGSAPAPTPTPVPGGTIPPNSTPDPTLQDKIYLPLVNR